MTERVDFYVLNSASQRQRHTIGCRLAEKAYLQNSKVLIALPSDAEASALDELLWTFHDRAFVPHHRCGEAQCTEPELPVHVCVNLERGAGADLLVNLCDRLPAQMARFARIAEVIDSDPERRRLGRERFKAYRDQKIALETHQLADAGVELPAP
jgi:DNA polymerase-3 subunit chi